ncbi:hypothetical protein [Peptoniphilus indolicus]|uniref:Uncharacterized protein n=1 Tax=Peptoniphilus indolicus ATCC 29427 TaxID=997350 RepID=G4D418_9FIRM|nr:hypothetical protein [Peptoniphilus indolicus]EGY79733.1 hypothetical protein HMPREF9129_1148 [Peptoniphilus indolicus ATCC 29427]
MINNKDKVCNSCKILETEEVCKAYCKIKSMKNIFRENIESMALLYF